MINDVWDSIFPFLLHLNTHAHTCTNTCKSCNFNFPLEACCSQWMCMLDILVNLEFHNAFMSYINRKCIKAYSKQQPNALKAIKWLENFQPKPSADFSFNIYGLLHGKVHLHIFVVKPIPMTLTIEHLSIIRVYRWEIYHFSIRLNYCYFRTFFVCVETSFFWTNQKKRWHKKLFDRPLKAWRHWQHSKRCKCHKSTLMELKWNYAWMVNEVSSAQKANEILIAHQPIT